MKFAQTADKPPFSGLCSKQVKSGHDVKKREKTNLKQNFRNVEVSQGPEKHVCFILASFSS